PDLRRRPRPAPGGPDQRRGRGPGTAGWPGSVGGGVEPWGEETEREETESVHGLAPFIPSCGDLFPSPLAPVLGGEGVTGFGKNVAASWKLAVFTRQVGNLPPHPFRTLEEINAIRYQADNLPGPPGGAGRDQHGGVTAS